MNRRLALVVIATLTLLSLTFAATVSAASTLAVGVEASASQYAAGSDAIFQVTTTGDDASGASLDFSVEGGTIAGVVSLNETVPGLAEGAVHVHRDTPGVATLIVSLGGFEVARSSVDFVAGQPLTVTVKLEAESSAAARTWSFDVVDSQGVTVAFVRVGTSGDGPIGMGVTRPLPFGRYTVKPVLGNDTAPSCGGNAFYVMTPATGIDMDVAPSGGAAVFSVRPCLLGDQGVSPSPDPADASGPDGDERIDTVAGARTAPLPPATGNGQAEKPTLPESHAQKLVGLLLATLVAFGLGTFVVRLLARIAPVKTKK